MTGWALIGTGQQVQNELLPALEALPQVRLVACVGTSTEKAEVITGGVDGAYGTDDLDRVLGDSDVDVVYVGSPNGLHYEHVRAALAAGKHVLCDKPLAVTSSQAALLVEAARDRGLRLGLVHQLRHHPAHLRARELIAAGDLGEILSIRVDYGSPSQLRGWRTDKARAGGAVLFNVGVHLIDLVRYLTGAEASQVAAFAELDPATGLDVSLSALLTMESTGAGSASSAFLWCSHRAGAESRALAVHGTHGSLVVHRSLRLTGMPDSSALIVHRGDSSPQEQTFAATPIMQRQVSGFDRAVTSGEESDPGPLDGLACVLVAEATMRSTLSSMIEPITSPDEALAKAVDDV